MAHYEMYICLPKTAWEENVPVKIKDKLNLIESVDEDTGDITYKSSITWNEAVFSGKLGAPRWAQNGDYCIVKGEFSMLNGELTSLQALGTDELYPNFSILTKTEAQTLSNSETFTGE
mgnify:CR=1 FL=1